MKWLKNVVKWFKADEVIEIEEIVLEDNEQLDFEELKNRGVKITSEKDSTYFRKTNHKKEVPNHEPVRDYYSKPLESGSNQGKKADYNRSKGYRNQEIEAKINYQYPKGQFRFPLIPDDSKQEYRKPRQPRREMHPSQADVQKPSIVPQKKQQLSTPRETLDEMYQRESMKKSGKRPFRPTDIPSPIHGFHKRPVKQEEAEAEAEFEFELNSVPFAKHTLLKGELEQKAVAPVHPEASAVEEQVDAAVPVTASFKAECIEEVDLPFLGKKEAVAELKADNEMFSIEEDAVPKADVNENEELIVGQQSTVNEVNAFADTLIEEQKLDSPVNADSDSAEKQTIPANMEVHETRPLSVEVETEAPEESIKSEMVDEPVITNYMSAFEETAAGGEQPAETVAQLETGLDEQEGVSADTENEEPIERPAKKHIPFNVVMLRQDREKWGNQFPKGEKKTVNPDLPIQPAGNIALSDDKPVQIEAVEEEFQEEDLPYYQFPALNLLQPPVESSKDDDWLDQQGYMLNETLHNFNVRASVVNITQGPAVTQFEVQPEPGVKVNKVTNLTDDIKLCLAAQDIRMEAPIPGKHTIGIEIPNRTSRPVFLREIIESDAFRDSESPLTVALGLDITGAPIVTDLRKMPHGLIAGATGSGKSVCINTMLVSLLYKATPQDLKVLLIDPKMVELAPYNELPHLVSPVITDVKAATAALKWAVEEMERRYELFAHTGVRDIQRFNKKAEEHNQHNDRLPFIVIIIDELADLMMMSPAEVEEAICRIAQKARACGIHLIVATQRPSVDVITGLIKANIPTRIAFSVSSQVDSRTIIDSAGAEKLLGRGDMLFVENGSSKNVRLQGTFVSDEEIEEVVDFVKKEQKPQYLFQQEDLLAKAQVSEERDELFLEACEFVVYQGGASTSSLQRRFHIGYNRAARLMDMMENSGIISEARGSRPRDVLMSVDDMQEWMEVDSEQA
ncbi:DNA translocase FtsK [Bacillus sp. 1P06AnD]|uniref:DNA translocase FtsK n=1 Tax=Bacillus sp. 1P06AnD TaxID=3132208 RepID=UPI0039A079D4